MTHTDNTNAIKVLKTRKHEIRFDDTDGKEQIVVKNSASGSTLTLKADGTVSVDAKKDLELTATGDMQLTAKNVYVKVAQNGVMDVRNTA